MYLWIWPIWWTIQIWPFLWTFPKSCPDYLAHMVNTFKCCARLRAYGGILLEVSGKSIVNKIEKGRKGLTLHIVPLTARGRRPAVQRTAGPGCRVSKSCHLNFVQINMEKEKVFRLFLARGSRSPRSLKLCLLGAFFILVKRRNSKNYAVRRGKMNINKYKVKHFFKSDKSDKLET